MVSVTDTIINFKESCKIRTSALFKYKIYSYVNYNIGVIILKIEQILKEYNSKKVMIEITEARIEQYKWAIAHPEEWYRDYIPEGRELGMPGAPKGSGIAIDPVSGYIHEKELNEEVLRDWIRREESKIFFKRLEVKQLDISLKILKPKELFIIQSKYIDKMAWNEIELSYTRNFHEQLTLIALKKKCRNAINELKELLQPFYLEYGYSID